MIEQSFLLELLKLKELNRAGWLRVGIEHPESVAAHSWGVACLAIILCPEELNKERVLTMAILHDLPEVRVGDITPHDSIPRKQKHQLEAKAAAELFALHPHILELIKEYEQNQTPEARFVHELDKLDMGLQAINYKQFADTSEFTQSAASSLSHALKSLIEP